MLNSSRTPVPIAVISAWISVFARTLSMRDFSTLRILPRSGSTAWVLRSRPCLAEPPAESPSTTNSSARDGSLTEQSASLPGSVEFSRADLRRGRARAVRAGPGGARALPGLHDHRARLARVLLQELAQAAVDARLDEARHSGVAELGLRLALDLGAASFAGHTRGTP